MDCSHRDTQSPDRLVAYMSLVQQAIKCKIIMKNLNEGIIQKCMQYTIDQLVYEDENRGTIETKLKSRGYTDFKSDTFIKGVNGVMLRILDNSMPLLLVNTILLNLVETLVLIKNNEGYPKHSLPISNRNKKIGLLVRCFNRVGNSYFGQGKEKESQMYCIDDDISCLKQSHIRKFILIVKEYLEVMEITDLSIFDSNSNQTVNNEESVGNIVCKILRFLNTKNLLIKNFEDLKHQKNSLSDEKVLTSFISQFSESSANYSELLNILGNSNYQEPISISPPITEDLKRVIELLSKNKTFSEGVKELKVYIQQTGGKFDFRSCFLKMNFEASFIEKVSTELNQLRVNGQNQTMARSLNPDIQGKLERLKMKLDRDNASNKHGDSKLIVERCTDRVGYNEGSNRNNFESKTPKNRNIVSRDMTSRDRSTEKQAPEDLKRRIEEMKNKVNMSTLGRIR